MNAITTGASAPAIFTFHTSAVRVIVLDGEPWFVAGDIAETLGYKNTTDMVRMLDEDEKGMHIVRTLGGDQEATIVSESGMYACVLKSRKPEAKPFRKWVTAEVLPAIRKTGRYEPQPYSVRPTDKLTKEEADTLRRMLREGFEKLPKDKQASAAIRGWSKLKAHFGVPYREIPRAEFAEAVSLVARHVAEVESLAAAPVQTLPDPVPSFAGRRWLMVVAPDGRETAKALDPEHFLTKIDEFPETVRDTGFLIERNQLFEIIHACVDRLAGKMAGKVRRVSV